MVDRTEPVPPSHLLPFYSSSPTEPRTVLLEWRGQSFYPFDSGPLPFSERVPRCHSITTPPLTLGPED